MTSLHVKFWWSVIFPQVGAFNLTGNLDNSVTLCEEFSDPGWWLWFKAGVGQTSLEDRRVILALKPGPPEHPELILT